MGAGSSSPHACYVDGEDQEWVPNTYILTTLAMLGVDALIIAIVTFV